MSTTTTSSASPSNSTSPSLPPCPGRFARTYQKHPHLIPPPLRKRSTATEGEHLLEGSELLEDSEDPRPPSDPHESESPKASDASSSPKTPESPYIIQTYTFPIPWARGSGEFKQSVAAGKRKACEPTDSDDLSRHTRNRPDSSTPSIKSYVPYPSPDPSLSEPTSHAQSSETSSPSTDDARYMNMTFGDIQKLYAPENGKLEQWHRKAAFEADPWVATFTKTSVRCRGCGRTLQMEKRGNRVYYPSNWIKHRDQGPCQQIKAGTFTMKKTKGT
ncbi:hypothetical protein VKT23_012947 [Stygiomarasmius scandens]|uniref:Uncharacterized protein n=1 Tax=Marasmiellus scandens TaxID=2682957 RepID=A0ABR1J4S3_9AGAR